MNQLEFDQVSKKYRIRQDQAPLTGRTAHFWQRLRSRSKEFWAVRDVSFQVEMGETLGVIGPNGAGKSTILKLLAGITTPTLGKISIRGRIAALLEVGAGFHPELTGRENIFLSGSILGMRRAEIARKLEDISDFAEVRPFIDGPVKRYSSGMYVRLGFSIAAHLEPDILLLDEVLAVGDADFQQKCRERIRDLRRAGTTIVFISHDLPAVEAVCDRVLLLDRGQVVSTGKPDEIVAQYQLMAASHRNPENPAAGAVGKRAHIHSVRVSDEANAVRPIFRTGFPMRVQMDYVVLEPLRSAQFSVYFYSPDSILYSQLTTRVAHGDLDLQPGHGSVEFVCSELGLQPGIYNLDATIEAADSLDPVERLRQCVTLRVDPGNIVRGLFYTSHQCRLSSGSEVALSDHE
jgi:ABC-type polysaccharide/polyol phosphate transport system ATPase subunit